MIMKKGSNHLEDIFLKTISREAYVPPRHALDMPPYWSSNNKQNIFNEYIYLKKKKNLMIE